MSHSSPPLAGFARRFVAHFLEIVWLVPLAYLLLLTSTTLRGDPPSALADAMIQLILLLIVLLFWVTRGATPGKIWVGLRIVDAATGGAVPFPRLVLRYLGYVVSALPLGLGFAWILWDRRRQGWHDKLAGTLVVHDMPNRIGFR